MPEDSSFYENDSLSRSIYDLMEVEDIERREVDVVPITSENRFFTPVSNREVRRTRVRKGRRNLYTILKLGKVYLRGQLEISKGLDELILEDLKKSYKFF